MALTTDARFRTRAQFLRALTTSPGWDKPALVDALAATDDWIEANQAAFNTALPLPFRTSATLAEKTLLFCYVAMRRAGILRAEED